MLIINTPDLSGFFLDRRWRLHSDIWAPGLISWHIFSAVLMAPGTQETLNECLRMQIASVLESSSNLMSCIAF